MNIFKKIIKKYKCKHNYKLARLNASRFLGNSETRIIKCTECGKVMPFSIHTLYSITSENYHFASMSNAVRKFYKANKYNPYIY